MRIAGIEVTNLRSFGPDTKVVALRADKNLVALVGASNAGKSNLIDAVCLALAAAARRSDLEPADFHQLDLSEQIRAAVRLLRRVLDRLRRIVDEIHIDEVQDLNGWDLEILERLLRSPIDVRMVGDVRPGAPADGDPGAEE